MLGGTASLGEVTSELNLKLARDMRQVKRVREACSRKKEQHVQRMRGSSKHRTSGDMKTILTSCGAPALLRANSLSKGQHVGFKALPFLGRRLESGHLQINSFLRIPSSKHRLILVDISDYPFDVWNPLPAAPQPHAMRWHPLEA